MYLYLIDHCSIYMNLQENTAYFHVSDIYSDYKNARCTYGLVGRIQQLRHSFESLGTQAGNHRCCLRSK